MRYIHMVPSVEAAPPEDGTLPGTPASPPMPLADNDGSGTRSPDPAATAHLGSTALAIMIGALLAAPVAAFLVNRLPGRLIAGAVGLVLIGINMPALIALIGKLL